VVANLLIEYIIGKIRLYWSKPFIAKVGWYMFYVVDEIL
jgi:hypothetical protein